MYNFVVYDENYKDMPRFAEISIAHGARPLFTLYAKRGREEFADEYERHAIASPSHPEHQYFLKIMASPLLANPLCHFDGALKSLQKTASGIVHSRAECATPVEADYKSRGYEKIVLLEEKEDDLEKALANLNKARQIVKKIEPGSTGVIVCLSALDEALAHYSALNPGNELPVFIVADIYSEAECALAEKKAALFGVRVLPIARMGEALRANYCLYGKASANLWQPGGIIQLCRLCAPFQPAGQIFVDTVSIEKFPLRNPCANYVRERMKDAQLIYRELADAQSRKTYIGALKCLATADIGYVPISSYPQYWHPRVHTEPGDFVIEGGPANGETALQFAAETGPKGMVVAFEPVGRQAAKAQRLLAAYPHAKIEHLGLWSGSGDFYIENKGNSSKLDASSTAKGEKCRSISIDEYCAANNIKCDFIKLDVEGAEIECLKGAREVIGKYHPKLQICLYHNIAHYFDIPLFIMREFPGYELYVGHHEPTFAETVLYARWKVTKKFE